MSLAVPGVLSLFKDAHFKSIQVCSAQGKANPLILCF